MKEWIGKHLTFMAIIGVLAAWGLWALLAWLLVDDDNNGLILAIILWLGILVGFGNWAVKQR